MAWCSRCFCCSLQQGAVFVAIYAVGVYAACLGVTIWWLSNAGSAVIPAFILAPIYFILLMAALTLLISLMFQAHVRTSVALFLITLGLLIMPEAALNVYTCISFLGVHSQMGLGLLIFFIVRGICNIICLLHLYSYYQNIRHGIIKPEQSSLSSQANQLIPMNEMMAGPGMSFPMGAPVRPSRDKNRAKKQQPQQNQVAPLMILSPLTLAPPMGQPFHPSHMLQPSRPPSELPNPNAIYSPDAGAVLERNRGAPVSHGNVVNYTPASPMIESDDSVSNVGAREPTVEMAPSESNISSRPTSVVGAVSASALVPYRRPRYRPSPQRPLAMPPQHAMQGLRRDGPPFLQPMMPFPPISQYSIPVPPQRSRWVMNGGVPPPSMTQNSLVMVPINGTTATHPRHPIFPPNKSMAPVQFPSFPHQPMMVMPSRSMPALNYPIWNGAYNSSPQLYDPVSQQYFNGGSVPLNGQVILAPPRRRIRGPNGVTLEPFNGFKYPETRYAGTSQAPSMVHLSANPQIHRSKSNASDSRMVINNQLAPHLNHRSLNNNAPLSQHYQQHQQQQQQQQHLPQRASQFDTTVPVSLLNGENPVPLGSTFDVDDSDTEAGFEKLLSWKMRQNILQNDQQQHRQQRLRHRKPKHQTLLTTVDENGDFTSNSKPHQPDSPLFSIHKPNNDVSGESGSAGDSGENQDSSTALENDNDGLDMPMSNYILTQQMQQPNLYEKNSNKVIRGPRGVDEKIRKLQTKAISESQTRAVNGPRLLLDEAGSPVIQRPPLILNNGNNNALPTSHPTQSPTTDNKFSRSKNDNITLAASGLLMPKAENSNNRNNILIIPNENKTEEKQMLQQHQHQQIHSFHENGDDARLIYYQQKAANSSSGVDSSLD